MENACLFTKYFIFNIFPCPLIHYFNAVRKANGNSWKLLLFLAWTFHECSVHFSPSLLSVLPSNSRRAFSGRCRNSGLRRTFKSSSILAIESLISLYLLTSKVFLLESLWKNIRNCLSRASGYKNSCGEKDISCDGESFKELSQNQHFEPIIFVTLYQSFAYHIQ